jgi:hypothetical protein
MRLVPVLLVGVGSGACGSPGHAVPVPWLAVEPTNAEVVDAPVGAVTVVPLSVTNTGTGGARVDLATERPLQLASERLQIDAGATVVAPVVILPSVYEDGDGAVSLVTSFQEIVVPITFTVDRDLDEDGAIATGAGGDDCDDADPTVGPAATETCDGVDEDCNGVVDDVDPPVRWYRDADLDGYGDATQYVEGCRAPRGHVDNADDCDDLDERVHPGADDVPNGVDDDCDGTIDG